MRSKILVVDDIEVNLNLIVNILELAGEDYDIITARNGRVCVDLALQECPDIILLDWEMPVMNGIDALRELKATPATADIPVLMVTAYTASEFVEEALDCGATDYIKKPINQIELRARVKSALKLNQSLKTVRIQNEQIQKQLDELQFLHLIAQKSSNSFVVFKPSGQIIWYNKAFCRMHQVVDEACSENLTISIFDIKIYNDIRGQINLCISEKEGLIYVGQAQNHGGPGRWLQITISPILSKKGKVERLAVIETDITEIKLKEEELNQRNAEMYEITDRLIETNTTLELQAAEINQQKAAIEEERQKSESLLRNIFPFEIARQLITKGAAKPRNYPMVTVLFTDFKNFSKISAPLDPVDLVGILDFYFKKFDEIIEEHFLEKIKTIGDAYMCVGGLPLRNRSNPVNAVLAGLEIQHFMNTLHDERILRNEPVWELRLGIHTGPVVAGVVGKKKFAYDIWGQTVNVASRMESAGHVGMVNISETTYNEVKDYFDCTYRGKVQAKNIGDIDMYFVQGIKPELSIDGKGIFPNDKLLSIIGRM